ncbi:MAG: prepilin-type N-terminal cleavage/methylation domain-containing protein, partial [Phycisphaerales bacterium]|nr:prepilin-type N-terminal cleavage/methylation domain-containing protein [Phycisphaerales bacterium]
MTSPTRASLQAIGDSAALSCGTFVFAGKARSPRWDGFLVHRQGSSRIGLAGGGFSLTELLIVIALIVLVMALALPAFNFITGTRSVEGAINTVNAVLGQARLEALASQKLTGLWFYIDPVSQRRAMALVQERGDRGQPNPRPRF